MTYAQKSKDKKGITSEECNKKELKMTIIIIIIIIIIIVRNDDYNDSNRKRKSLKVATKKTLKIKEFFFPDF